MRSVLLAFAKEKGQGCDWQFFFWILTTHTQTVLSWKMMNEFDMPVEFPLELRFARTSGRLKPKPSRMLFLRALSSSFFFGFVFVLFLLCGFSSLLLLLFSFAYTIHMCMRGCVWWWTNNEPTDLMRHTFSLSPQVLPFTLSLKSFMIPCFSVPLLPTFSHVCLTLFEMRLYDDFPQSVLDPLYNLTPFFNDFYCSSGAPHVETVQEIHEAVQPVILTML